MSMLGIFNISGSAVSAQSQRLNVVASNLANAATTSGSEASAFRAKRTVFKTIMEEQGVVQMDRNKGGVKVQAIPKNEKFRIQGAFSGNLSNLVYYSYAASYTEIQGLMNMGPSAKTVSKSEDTPPYLADTYWTTSYQLQN